MNLRRHFALSLGVAAALSVMAPAFAQEEISERAQTAARLDGEHGRCPDGGHGCGLLEGPLKLTDQQAEKLYAIRNSAHDQIATKVLEIHTLKRQIMDMMAESTIDRKGVTDLQNRVIADKTAIETVKASSMLDAAEVFTPEQRHAFHERVIRGGFWHGHKHGHGDWKHGHGDWGHGHGDGGHDH